MANRDLTSTQFRQITKQVVENKSDLLTTGAAIGETILRQRQEAKIAEGISVAQLELGKLDNQYRIDYEGDPMGGLDKYKQERQKIFDTVGKGISPLYGREWINKTRQISTRSDATQQAWALKQSRVNTIDSVNDTMKNNFKQSNLDGKTFGLSDESEIEAFVNFGTSMEQLQEFASKNLGSETAEGMLETYEQDYLKSFISGVSETNPHKALKLVESEQVQNSFTDMDQLGRFKSAIQSRVKRFDAANKQASEARQMAGTNSLLNQVGKMGYAELQGSFSEFNVSPEARAFYEEVNGYANTKRRLTEEEKADGKNKFNIFMSSIIEKEDLTNNDIKLLQDSVFAGMRKDVLTKNEGFGLLNGLLDPVIAEQQERAAQFETGKFNPFQENLGLKTLNQEIAKISGVDQIVKYKTGENAGEIKSAEQRFNLNKNQNMMYDVYLQSLGQQAKERNIDIRGLTKLSFKEEKAVYDRALKDAKEVFIRSNFPSLANAKELPSTVVTPKSNVNLTDADIDSMTEAELDKFLANQ